jgi:dipeptidyl aminopeptidase/acylaminoacyl peptidase
MSEFTDAGWFSPDGRYYVTLTQRGVLPQGVSEATLWLFETARIRTQLNQPSAAAAAPVVLARMSAAVNGGGYDSGSVIMHLEWAGDSRSVMFLGRDGQENRRLYRVGLDDRRVAALTPPQQDVVDYGSAAHAIAYLAGPDVAAQKAWWSDDPSAPDIVAGTGRPLIDLLYPNYAMRTQTMPTEFEVWRIGEAGAEPVIDAGTGKALRMLASYNVSTVDVSADGKRVIAIAFADRIPALWEKYELAVDDYDLRRFVADPVSKDGAAPTLEQRSSDFSRALQYELIDMDAGTRRPLLEAPLADFQRGGTDRLQAAWSADGRDVAVSATYLPVGARTDAGSALRVCAIAAMSIRSGEVACIREHDPKSAPLYALEWKATGRQLVVHHARPGSPGIASELYQRGGPDWTRAKSPPRAAAAPFEISVVQTLNEPPALLAKDPLNGKHGTLFDPNPQLAGIDLGSVSVYTWKDKHDRLVRGGLAKPPDFEPGHKYGLVIQTHGFAPGSFFRMGYSETSSGGRALAGREMLVLQVAEPHPPFFGTWREGTENGTEVYLAAIDQLAAEGLVDPAKVGITGYSRRGFYVAKAITDAPDRFAAAVIANADPGTLVGYYTYVDYATPTYITGAAEAFAGVAPYGEGLQQWLQRTPGFRTDRIRAPVLISAADPQHLISLWGLYAPLRDQGKPVELQYMRSGQHNLTKPLQKLAHQEMIVDWFDFWLNGHEQADPAKAEQYARWRKLRDLHDAQAAAAPH